MTDRPMHDPIEQLRNATRAIGRLRTSLRAHLSRIRHLETAEVDLTNSIHHVCVQLANLTPPFEPDHPLTQDVRSLSNDLKHVATTLADTREQLDALTARVINLEESR